MGGGDPPRLSGKERKGKQDRAPAKTGQGRPPPREHLRLHVRGDRRARARRGDVPGDGGDRRSVRARHRARHRGRRPRHCDGFRQLFYLQGDRQSRKEKVCRADPRAFRRIARR